MEKAQVRKEHQAVTAARNTGDIWVLIAGIGVLAGIWFVIFLIGFFIALSAESVMAEDGLMSFIFENIGYLLVGLVFLGIAMIATRIMRQTYLANALEVRYSNYAWLRDWANQVAAELDMPQVEIFITQDPVINAFAMGFYRPYTIVLNSGSIRYLSRDEIKAIVVHEMAHVKFNHTNINVYLSFINAFPFVGAFSQYVFGFWGRRAELTSDRLALMYLRDVNLVKNALVKVHVGPDVAKDFNQIARDWQVYKSNNVLNSFSQTLSSHPFLVRRLQHIDKYSNKLTTHKTKKEVDAATA